jgi:hypothetical protein
VALAEDLLVEVASNSRAVVGHKAGFIAARLAQLCAAASADGFTDAR